MDRKQDYCWLCKGENKVENFKFLYSQAESDSTIPHQNKRICKECQEYILNNGWGDTQNYQWRIIVKDDFAMIILQGLRNKNNG